MYHHMVCLDKGLLLLECVSIFATSSLSTRACNYSTYESAFSHVVMSPYDVTMLSLNVHFVSRELDVCVLGDRCSQ
ncbi:Threonine--tRNA ligase, cytoplasmic [Fusarium oxysporum f. sp. albedinis]|nr:Threonine--tRNA ligase, cytoplasmic [Fusarium oxysporum f. sp. albedinis]